MIVRPNLKLEFDCQVGSVNYPMNTIPEEWTHQTSWRVYLLIKISPNKCIRGCKVTQIIVRMDRIWMDGSILLSSGCKISHIVCRKYNVWKWNQFCTKFFNFLLLFLPIGKVLFSTPNSFAIAVSDSPHQYETAWSFCSIATVTDLRLIAIPEHTEYWTRRKNKVTNADRSISHGVDLREQKKNGQS